MIPILYEDGEILIAVKPAGLVSERSERADGVMDRLEQERAESGETLTLFPIHRLDREVGGVMAFAKTRSAAAWLSSLIAERALEKEYLTVVEGSLAEREGLLEDLLYHDPRKNKTYVVARPRRGVRPASLTYSVLEEREGLSLLRVTLHTGRTHQIRVQVASRKHPVAGDRRYGSRIKQEPMALFSHRITLIHPKTEKLMSFSATPDALGVWGKFDKIDDRNEEVQGHLDTSKTYILP